MFEDENDDMYEQNVNDDLKAFNEMYKNNNYTFFDCDRIEGIIDHLFVSGQYKKAIWAAEKAFEQFPFNPIFKLRKAQAMSLSGELKEAIQILLEIERQGEKSQDLFLSLASSFSQLRDSDSAIKYFTKALGVSDQEERADIYIDLAMEYENQDEFLKAIKVLEKGIKEDPKNESLVYEMAYCYDQLGGYEKAIQCFQEYIDIEPYSYTAWYNLANAYARIKEYEKAIWAYDYCIVINEEFAPAYFNIGNTYAELEMFEEALVNYQKCVEIDGDDAMVYCSIGECLEELEHYEEALIAYKKSSDLLPQLADAWAGRGVVNNVLGKGKVAIQEIKKAIEMEPSNYSYHHSLANILEDQSHTTEAIAAYHKAIELNNTDDRLIIEYLHCLTNEDPVRAMELFYAEERIHETNASKLAMTYTYWVMNRRTDAQLILEDLIHNDPSLAKSLFLHFPSLEEVEYFVERLENIDE